VKGWGEPGGSETIHPATIWTRGLTHPFNTMTKKQKKGRVRVKKRGGNQGEREKPGKGGLRMVKGN